MIKAGQAFIVAYKYQGTFINIALSDCDNYDKSFSIKEVFPDSHSDIVTTIIGEEDTFEIIDLAELLDTLKKLQKTNPEVFI